MLCPDLETMRLRGSYSNDPKNWATMNIAIIKCDTKTRNDCITDKKKV